jgi:hypothetical protein
MTKTTRPIPLPGLAPRNPLVAPSLRRGGAGRHGPARGALRQRMGRALRHELQDLHPPHY